MATSKKDRSNWDPLTSIMGSPANTNKTKGANNIGLSQNQSGFITSWDTNGNPGNNLNSQN